ncbi:MAG: hypothetical protein C0475_09170 [Planctomyces sp.]|nr:hypothetical protein [Planctomyces sp.]
MPEGSQNPPRHGPNGGGLERTLRGDLPCVTCRYELRGLSVLGVCPECGTAVRATILAAVDPHADELQPIRARWRVAAGLLVWNGSAAAAALWLAAVLAMEVAWAVGRLSGPAPGLPRWGWWVVAGLIALSGAGAWMFARPTQHTSRRTAWAARLGGLTHGVIVAGVLWEAGLRADAPAARWTGPAGTDQLWEPAPERTAARALALLGCAAAVLLVRPVARQLVARSLALRTGRVDRQTLAAVSACALLMLAGDLCGLAGRGQEGLAGLAMTILGVGGMALGALLLSLGVLGAMADSVRIARAVRAPAPSLREVLAGPEGHA